MKGEDLESLLDQEVYFNAEVPNIADGQKMFISDEDALGDSLNDTQFIPQGNHLRRSPEVAVKDEERGISLARVQKASRKLRRATANGEDTIMADQYQD